MDFVSFDVETRGIYGDFYSGAIVGPEGYRFYSEDRGKFVRTLAGVAGGKTLIAHNAEYDIAAALWTTQQRVDVHYYSNQFHRAYWYIPDTRKPVEIWDSLNLAAGVELAALGEAIGLSKYPTPQMLKGREVYRYQWKCELHSEWECIQCYNVRDAEIVYRFASDFSSWFAAQGLTFKRTLAGNAVALWNAVDREQIQTLKAPLIKDMARLAYHAGRCECFKVGQIDGVYTADMAAYYLSILRDCPMPDIASLTYVKSPKTLDLEGTFGVVEATVDVPQMYVPPLPIKMPDGHIYYPIGVFRGHWVIPELMAAVRLGVRIKAIHRIAYTRKAVFPFPNFAGILTLLRKEYTDKQDARSYVVKTLANSLPGRLGMRESQDASTYQVRPGFLTDAEVRGNDVVWINGNKVLITKRPVKMLSKTNNILWAATINAWGRIKMAEHLNRSGGSLIYTDTDSVMSMLPIDTEGNDVGQLRDTGRYKRGYFFSPKLYRLEGSDGPDQAVARGIPKQLALQFMTEGTVSFEAPAGIIMGLKTNTAPTHWLTLTRTNRNRLSNRVVLNPSVTQSESSWSDTLAPSVGPSLEPPESALSRDNVSR